MATPSPRRGRLILVRHGQSEGNRTRTFTHSPAVPLTDLGRQQARQAAAEISRAYRPARVVSSPYARALETGQIVAEALRLPLEVEEVWREQSLGQLAGQPYERVLEDPAFDRDRAWAWRPPGGESLIDVRRRVAPAFDRLVGASAGLDVVLVSHAGVMQALWAHVTDSWAAAPVTPNGGLVVIEHDGTRCGPPTAVTAA